MRTPIRAVAKRRVKLTPKRMSASTTIARRYGQSGFLCETIELLIACDSRIGIRVEMTV